MDDEFDAAVPPAIRERELDRGGGKFRPPDMPTARLVSTLYRAADPALRSRLLACLLRPLGPLALVGVAAGAFAQFLHRNGSAAALAAVDDVPRYSGDQIAELAHFVEQVSPEAVQEFARILADHPVGMAAFGVSAAALLAGTLRRGGTTPR